MPRIAGVEIPEKKHILIALTYVYGIGRSLSADILEKTHINPTKRTKDLTADEVSALRSAVETMKLEGELRREITANIKRLKDIGAYRGIRHAKGLPVRGQRTKTNSRTVRGNVRRTMGSGRKPAASPT